MPELTLTCLFLVNTKDKKELSEIDICDLLITPALEEGVVSIALIHSNTKSVEVAAASIARALP